MGLDIALNDIPPSLYLVDIISYKLVDIKSYKLAFKNDTSFKNVRHTFLLMLLKKQGEAHTNKKNICFSHAKGTYHS